MKTTGLLFLTTLCFVVLTRSVSSLRAGGRNVRTRWVSYSERLARDTTTLTSSRTCTKTCTWRCCNCRRCKTAYRQKYKTVYYYVTRYRPIYYCAHGWMPNGDECTTPICTGGCANGGTCISPGRCRCRPGWRGLKCRTDINECKTNNGGCQHHCSNSQGSYSCYCDPGYTKSGFSNCQDINECHSAHNCQQNCVNNPGTYSCTCRIGYRLDNNGKTCSDIDECLQPICQYKCDNTAGSFFCTCPQGYLLTSNRRDCADHDECTTGHHTCGQRCVNHPGGYTCACHTGFSLNNNNRTCSDVDECKSGLAGCAYQCNNTMGSFQCICPTGYFLNPDNRTCSDHDECGNGQHTCSQICGNTPGSYYCACRPGYYLDGDFRTCKGYPCSSITKPAKGYMNCTGNTVDSVCQFSCQPGYELVGTQLRTCLTNAQWNGGRSVCKIKHCNRPTPPTNGFVQIPCLTTYQGKCSFDCRPGYFLNGSRIVSCSADSKWVPIPGQCDAITVCQPNPCLNGGACHPINGTAFWCNCTDTAHIGRKCHVGILRTPKYPRLQQNDSLNVTFELSPPVNELKITSNAAGLDFHPRDLVIAPVKLEQGRLYIVNMTITARLPGIHQITYYLSGDAAKTYQAVLPDTVIVLENGSSCNDSVNINFPVGCHKIALYKCPKGNDFLYAKSTETWQRSQKRVSTKGAASIVSGNLTLPLGLQGATLDKINHSSTTTDKEHCLAKSPKDLECLPSETLATVFLQSINGSFPSWFRLIPSKTLSGLKPNDVITYIWTGTELKGVLKGLGLSLNDESYYSVLLYTGAITVEVNESSVKLPKYGKNSFLLVAVELCSQVLPAKVVLALNPLSYVALKRMPVYRQLATLGWNVSALAMQFSSQSRLGYSVNIPNQGNIFIPGNLELYGRVEKSIIGSHPINSFKLRLVGNAIIEIQETNKAWTNKPNSWTAGLRGQVTVSIVLLLLKQQVSFDIPLDSSSGQVQYQDSKNTSSCKFQGTYELFLNGLLRKDPFASTLLGSFIASANSNITFFAKSHNVNVSSSKTLSISAIHFRFQQNGTVKFGPLKFPNMTINTEVFTDDFGRCDGDRNAQELKLSATFNQKAALGRFFTTSDSDSVQIFLPFDSQNKTEGIFNTTVTLLGDSFKTQVAISNNSISFKRDFHLFHTYRLSVIGSSRLQPWDFLPLKVTGIFGRPKLSGGDDALEDVLKALIRDYINVVVENTAHRLRTLQNTDDKMKARIDKSKTRLVQAENNTNLAVTRYLWALKAQIAALKEVNTAGKNVSNSNHEFNQLKASLERLCSVIQCPYVCVTGRACNTCYKDLISEEQGLCPAICHNVLKERLPPFKEMATCLEEDCDHSGGDFLSFVGCNFEKVGAAVLTTAAKAVVTYGLVSIGVPPQVAYPIASGAVTYAVTGNEEKAVKSAAAAGVWQYAEPYVSPYVDMAKEKVFGPSDPKDPGVPDGVFGGVVDAYNECNDEGDWKCTVEPKPCEKNVFNYKFTNVPYSCEISCQVSVIKETLATPCCKEVNCASRIRDLKCTEKNAFCRNARDKAFSKFNVAKRNLVKPFIKLQKANKKLRVVEIELAKQKIELEAASSERNTLRRAHDALVKAANISQRANNENRALIQDAITLAQLWNNTNQTFPVEIKEISFDVTLYSPSETNIPVMFKIEAKNIEKEIFPILNFASLNESLQQTAKQIVKELFGNVSAVFRSGHPLNQMASAKKKGRRKRAIDEDNTDVTTLVQFKRKCALVTNYQHVLTDIIDSLYKISTQSLLTLNNATNHTIKQQHARVHDFTVNQTQAAELGLTDKDVNDAIESVSSDEEVIGAASLIELRNATNHNKVQTAIEVVYRDWEASMERVFNCTSLECNGFVDCMEDFVDNLYYLYQDVNLPEAVNHRQKVAVLAAEVKTFVSLKDLSMAEAAEKSFRILQILQAIKNEKIFCAVAPNVTTHPVAMKDMKIGQTLELNCKATGDPAPLYRWRKNGALLPGSNTENLRIEKVRTNDGGNYTCEAYNHVSVESSTPSFVLVHSPPTLVNQPRSKLNIPINTGFYLRCKATSLSRPLRYQWIFMPLSGNGYSLVPNGNFSVLRFDSAQKHEEGFYKCNVSNPFDYTLSQGVQVRVLGFSLVVPSLGLSFELLGDNKSLHDSYKESNKVDMVGSLLHVSKSFELDVQLSFTSVVNNLVKLSSSAVQNLAIKDCKSNERIDNITCVVSFRLHSLNVTGPESMNRTEKENALSVMESVTLLKQSAAVLVNESTTRGISLNVKDVSLYIDPASWQAGEYRSVCPIGTVLYVNNFVCVHCPPGTHGGMNGTSSACFPCQVGTYQPDQGQTSCIPCPADSDSHRTGLETLSSCKDPLPEATTSSRPTSRFTGVPAETTAKTTVQSTPKEETRTTKKEFERTSTKSPDALRFEGDKDVAARWKMAFGVCVAIIVILMAGVILYVIHYRIKKIRHFKTAERGKTENDQTFQNPIYDVNEVVNDGPVLSKENPIYQLEDPPVVNEIVKQESMCSHDNPCYQAEDPDPEESCI